MTRQALLPSVTCSLVYLIKILNMKLTIFFFALDKMIRMLCCGYEQASFYKACPGILAVVLQAARKDKLFCVVPASDIYLTH